MVHGKWNKVVRWVSSVPLPGLLLKKAAEVQVKKNCTLLKLV